MEVAKMQGREQQMPFLRMGIYRDSPGGQWLPPQYSRLENPMDGGAWQSMGSLRVGQD